MSEVEIESEDPRESDAPPEPSSEAGAPAKSATFGKPPADPADTVEDPPLSEQEELEAERDRLKDRLLRTAADFDNFRKRARKDAEAAETRGRESILREMLTVIDNLERAVAASEGVEDVDAIRDGVRMVLKLFEDVSGRVGLERVPSLGERFDPNFHDAFQQVETDEQPPGTVIQEYQPGYTLKGRLLRPAMVVVARKPSDKGADESE